VSTLRNWWLLLSSFDYWDIISTCKSKLFIPFDEFRKLTFTTSEWLLPSPRKFCKVLITFSIGVFEIAKTFLMLRSFELRQTCFWFYYSFPWRSLLNNNFNCVLLNKNLLTVLWWIKIVFYLILLSGSCLGVWWTCDICIGIIIIFGVSYHVL